VRGRKLGPFNQIDLVLQLNPTIPMKKAYQLEEQVRSSVKESCENVQDVMIYLQDPAASHQIKHHEHDHHHHSH
jgi:divalent metal cation (Fe/Co/Zn/Cd) transporter